LTERSVVTAIS
jgi:hypothetical protein